MVVSRHDYIASCDGSAALHLCDSQLPEIDGTDGYKAASIASDYRRFKFCDAGVLNVHLAPGGGFAAIVKSSATVSE